jgi:nucleoside phosphorylase
MPFNIEIISVGGDFDKLIGEVATALNGEQKEFHFGPAPDRLRSFAAGFVKPKYNSNEVFEKLKAYRTEAKGHRPYLIGVIDGYLDGSTWGNIFGSHDAREGVGEAVITLCDHELFSESQQLYLCYYFVRYALSFVCPRLKNHDDTRSCFFDRKQDKRDLKLSMDSGGLCLNCRAELWTKFNDEINVAVQRMISVMKALRTDSQAALAASSLRGQIDIGIITIREDEFGSMLDRLPARRHVKGTGSDYQYAKVRTKAEEELRVVVARSPEQGQGAAQALASSMITDLAPRWIFLVGIAGGFPAPEYTLGDVLLSQRMHDFAVSAAIEDKPPEFQDMGGPMVLEVEKLVTGLKGHRAKLGSWSSKEFLGKSKPKLTPPSDTTNPSLYGNDDWKSKVLSSLKAQFPDGVDPRNPDFFAAVIIAGNTLVKDTVLPSQWRQTARHASGVEMELGGVCRAARYGTDGQTRVLAIRGLSDIVGYKRSPEWTEYACRSAAAFADALIQSGLIMRDD